jgi:predicted nucleic acid-binding protein
MRGRAAAHGASRRADDQRGAHAFDQLLALRVRRVDTAPLLREAWNMRANVTVADALDVALVTGDVRLAQAPGLGVHVLTL